MKLINRSGLFLIVLGWLQAGLSVHADQSTDIALRLPSTDGESVMLSPADARLTVVCFLGCECPLAKLYADRLNGLAEEFESSGVRFIGVNSNPQDAMEKVAKFAADHRLRFPMLKDHDSLARVKLSATRTPEVFVIKSDGEVIYRGRIDDQYRPGVMRTQPDREDLREAIKEHLAGRAVSVPVTEAAGCLMAKPRKVDPACEVTYCKDIAPLLQRHCVECHREGEIGPFALMQYEDVTGWADMILETVEQRRMPPWHATADFEPLVNARELSANEREQLRRWVEGGTPYGDASDLPAMPAFTSGWQLPREPDLVLDVSQSPYHVAAEGTIEYQYFVVDPGFEEDTWVEAAEILPGNRSVLHHAIAFIRPPDGVNLTGLGMLTGYVPGQRVAPVTAGLAKRVPAGSKFVFQMHYTPTGKEETDLSRLGLLIVEPSKVTHEAVSLVSINHDLEIPPGEANVKVTAMSKRLPEQGKLLSIAPHMHLRGKAVSVHVNRDGKSRTILEVPHYDFNWQHTYILRDPIELDDIDSLGFTAAFDNSEANPFNPDPTQFVTWGDQTWEEMAVVFYEVAKPLKPIARVEISQDKGAKVSPSAEEQNDRHEKMADELMADLDRNRDGVVDFDELELSVKWRLFKQLDRNGDRQITRDEALRYVQSR
jgi:peroxiredoxin